MKDILTILFLIAVLFMLTGCSKSDPYDSAVRIFIGANINGKIYESDVSEETQTVSLSRVATLIKTRMDKQPRPTVMIQMGNTAQLTGDDQLKNVQNLSRACMEMGFKANLVSELEINDSEEYAKKRAEFGVVQVLSNVKPLEGSEPPVNFEKHYRIAAGNGQYVYFINFISKVSFDKSELLSENYEWLDPARVFPEIVDPFRLKDIVVVYYQNNNTSVIKSLFELEESSRISLLAAERQLYSKLISRRPENMSDVNIIKLPDSATKIESVEIWWEPSLKRWRMNNQTLTAGLSYQKDEDIERILMNKQSGASD